MFKTLLAMCLLVTACTSTDSSNIDNPGKDDLVGNRKQSETCEHNWQCRADDDLVCRPTSPHTYQPDLRCMPRSTAGGLCATDEDCTAESGIVCRPEGAFDDPANRCLALSSVGGSCEFDDDCQAGTVCNDVVYAKMYDATRVTVINPLGEITVLKYAGSCLVP